MATITEHEGIFKVVDTNGNVKILYPDVKTDKSLSTVDKPADAAAVDSRFTEIEQTVETKFGELDQVIAENLIGGVIELSQAEYDEITASDAIKEDVAYFITDGLPDDAFRYNAKHIAYDNTESGFVSGNVQDVVDEIKTTLTTSIADVNNNISALETSFSTAANDIGNAIVAVGGTVPEGASFAEMAAIITNAMVCKNDVIGESVTWSQSFSDISDEYANSSVSKFSGEGVSIMANGAQILCKMDVAQLSMSATGQVCCWTTDDNRVSSLSAGVYVNGAHKGTIVNVTNRGSDSPGSSSGSGSMTLKGLKAGDYITIGVRYGSSNEASTRFVSLSGKATVVSL